MDRLRRLGWAVAQAFKRGGEKARADVTGEGTREDIDVLDLRKKINDKVVPDAEVVSGFLGLVDKYCTPSGHNTNVKLGRLLSEIGAVRPQIITDLMAGLESRKK